MTGKDTLKEKQMQNDKEGERNVRSGDTREKRKREKCEQSYWAFFCVHTVCACHCEGSR